jgi:phospholipid-binding lipoprotein MlaA
MRRLQLVFIFKRIEKQPMKFFFTSLALLFFLSSSLYAQKEAVYVTNKNCPAEEHLTSPCDRPIFSSDSDAEEDDDPLEPINRGIFWLNEGIDYVLIEPLALFYKEVFPEFVRQRIGFILRNLNEPVIFASNLLQGDLEEARITLGRFLINSTVGVAGIFDVSTDYGLPYKKQDLGLTFASWGIDPGPYFVIPILGPSNIRDALGRAGDFVLDPINWIVPVFQGNGRTSAQILDAKTDNLEITGDLKKNSLDTYANFRTWYSERRKALMTKVEERKAIDTPRPDDEEELEERISYE